MKDPDISSVCYTIKDSIDVIIDNCPDDAVLVESGTYLGNTAAFLVTKLARAGKTFRVYTIDNFLHSNVGFYERKQDQFDAHKQYLGNIRSLGVDPYITTIVGDTLESVSKFCDRSVYCVLLDDCPQYSHVKQQINLWVPKIIRGGLLIADDYNSNEVKRVFDETFGRRVIPIGTNKGGCYIQL